MVPEAGRHDTPSIAFLAGIADHDPTAALRSLSCPILAVFGAEDLLVPVGESARVVATILRDAGHDDHEIVVFPGADHNLRFGTARAPGFDELVVTWLQRWLCHR
ncbi:alpha/beta hydrolase family protein [Micromonospora andamanensis]|uniref:Peptidase S9 prolyl oligopeptidase catalytic domain-containing protein n=1 Tax=Micromonospora andamanensis TaxID=1287068 RepID=A0ABQ4I5D5_9ACTN|nr:prolyl oligopeptidase family serine peptidase [Micromonospora andamanensis]GIJ13079.1 hypothetical protein Van01_62930 [Micromonospora andamanensis]